MGADGDDIDELVERAGQGDGRATEALFARYRRRLRRMVAVRMDSRLAARLDPSDVVQETLVQAIRMLPEYLRRRPLPFYPWLRQLAWQRLMQLHREHVVRQKRSINREEPQEMALPDESVAQLADRLAASGTSPSARLVEREMIARVQSAFGQLASSDREILILRHLEQLSVNEAAEVLGISATAVTTRHFRAMQRLHRLLE